MPEAFNAASKPPSYTLEMLDFIRSQIAPDDDALEEARERRDATRDAAKKFGSTNRSFSSGSLAHRTANCPIHHRDAGLDADCGVVLDRRAYPALGPDSASQVGPVDVVHKMAGHLEKSLKPCYPKLKVKVTKRAILLTFNEPLLSGADPTVDIVVGLDRVAKPGLWIPNTESNQWDPSHPEKHTELLTAEPASLRLARQHAIRLAKAENKRIAKPLLCSFNIEALGWMFVGRGMNDTQALLAVWRDGAADLERRPTPDPADVSASIKVEDRAKAVEKLRFAARQLQSALDHDDDAEWVRKALAQLFPEFVPPMLNAMSTAQRVAVARNPGAEASQLRFGDGGVLGLSGAAAVNTSVRSYGDPH